MDITELIAKKRDGGELSGPEIRQVVSAFVAGEVGEGPMAALLMAICLRGMSAAETTALTMAMAESGQRLDLSDIPGTKVDKHSTGGVGDKATLVVAPLVAALGVPVAKLSGRALGHTGGTIEKLEAIPGVRTDLSPDEFRAQVARIGVAIACQTEDLAPADKKIYALRDATATVESIPLIAASVMSKKLAAGADAIALDVKCGRGAFMRTLDQARTLAETMVSIGAGAGKPTVALVTRMDQPLGRAVGDAAEAAEAIQTLSGKGPPDLVELCVTLAGHMAALGGVAQDPATGAAQAREVLLSGRGKEKLRELIIAQGGDGSVADDPARLVAGGARWPVMLSDRGYVRELDARQIGLAVRRLKQSVSEGRQLCGVILERKMGERVTGEPVAFVLGPPGYEAALSRAGELVAAAFQVGPEPPPGEQLIAAVIS